MTKKYPLLDKINLPKDVRTLPQKDLKGLCDDVRSFLIETITQNGGHFGANLGVVELTVALHRIFDTPTDKIIWDVGHQAYAHKVLTGRKEQLHTIRKKNGLSPFPKRSESSYDTLGVGHSSTSISAGIGMALAHRGERNPPHVTAVIGDGALTGGMAYEALNHGGDVAADVLVILNDNKMSISPNVGAMDKYLTRLISSPQYLTLREQGKKILSKVPTVQEIVRRTEEYAKGMITPGTLFEELGWGYYGPIDGHDIDELLLVLENLKEVRGPRLLHVVTEKGKGHAPAKKDALSMHAVGAAQPDKSKKGSAKKKEQSYTTIFSEWICMRAQRDQKLHAITPAMREGSGLVEFEQKFHERYHDVGIAEQHAVTFATGLACEGAKPVVAIYSTFLQRGYDQLIHDVAVQNLDVLFAIDRAGVVGPDGATHAGSFDLSYLRCIPHLVVAVPATGQECTALLDACYAYPGPAAVRYPRGSAHTIAQMANDANMAIEIGKGLVIKHGDQEGKNVAILAWGAMVSAAQKAADETGATLVNMRFVKPLDEELLRKLAQTHDVFVTVEDNAVIGGAGSAVNEFVVQENLDVAVKNLGLPDAFLSHGSREELLEASGLDEDGIMQSIQKYIIE